MKLLPVFVAATAGLAAAASAMHQRDVTCPGGRTTCPAGYVCCVCCDGSPGDDCQGCRRRGGGSCFC
ncbi:uncharacterized protein UV8b_07022 [Ustilaginoidea virens]|uniref:Uncharacterized protein n=1 Tax=Ustilaginoidea virens TaxID=1159556 RepID=A0A8E5HWD9_USTVR|nr:uncharacterized protein UV8b_07022 [Ustilaginoidea virens]QUC22781.1 hypothetical protein UV8b_07022 [Ustilaginoidea virens]